MRLKSRIFLASALLGAVPAHADSLTIDLPGAASAERQTIAYTCSDGGKVSAEYVNAGVNSLAIVKFGGETVLMVNVLSASGARYAGQQYIWWTKGNSADFYDLTKGEDAASVFSCTAG